MPDVSKPNDSKPTATTGESPGPAPEVAPFPSVLVPVDFSLASRAALALAVQMTAPWSSEVIVFNAPGMSENDGFLQGTGAQWERSDVLSATRDHLRSFADRVAPGSGKRIRVEARRDEDFVSSVVHACQQLGASLVILGSGKGDRPRWWKRSSAERVARKVTCPVLVVPN
ncbi:MAG: universal stress protein [Polyangiaceae bacterium]|nr:universal stress protein [Polyangiaceae bacterium]